LTRLTFARSHAKADGTEEDSPSVYPTEFQKSCDVQPD